MRGQATRPGWSTILEAASAETPPPPSTKSLLTTRPKATRPGFSFACETRDTSRVSRESLSTVVACALLAHLGSPQPGLAESSAARAEHPIIDMHLHSFGWDEYGAPPPANEITGRVPEARTDDEALAATLAEMERHGIVLGVASGPLEIVDRWREQEPRRFLGGAYVTVREPLLDVSMLHRAFTSGRLAVFGELGLQYRGLAPDDPSMEPYFALAEELDVPVALHTGLGDAGAPYGCCPDFRAALGNPLLLEEVLVRHPRLRIYLMHAGYPYLDDTIALLSIYPQVYVDIAVLNWALPRAEFHRYFEALVVAGFGERILFGSDQMVWPEAIGMALDGVQSAPFLTPRQKRDILYWNAARFLRLSDEEIDRHHRQVGTLVSADRRGRSGYSPSSTP